VQDKGSASPAVKAAGVAPVRLTTQLPATLSPHHRPHQIGPSPRMPAHVPSRGTGSSSSSSIASSPLQSPRTNPGSGADSPQKEPLDLPPPAFPSHHSLAFPGSGSVPVKIPRLSAKHTPSTTPVAAAQTPGSQSGSLYPIGNSIDTLRFGRRPGVVNSVTSPNALAARCSCGKPFGHPGSKERMESGLANLSLGPSLVAPHPVHGTRVASNPVHKPSHSGHTTPNRNTVSADIEHHTVSSTLGASLLSRSRSDPMSSSPKHHGGISLIAPMTRPDGSAISPNKDTVPAPSSGHRQGRPEHGQIPSGRGRSLERHQPHHLELSQAGVLNQSREREQAPSRSRHRRDERPERRSSKEPAGLPTRPVYANAADAGWSRRPSTTEQVGGGIAPPTRRPGQSGDTSPQGRAGYGLRTGNL
jgi:hypothetical protein